MRFWKWIASVRWTAVRLDPDIPGTSTDFQRQWLHDAINEIPELEKGQMNGIMDLMKQAQQMGGEMRKAQKELAAIEVQGESGGGMVRVVMTCTHRVRRLEIEDRLLEDRKSMLEDLVAAAFNDAIRKVERTVKERFSGLAGGVLPAGMKLPF